MTEPILKKCPICGARLGVTGKSAVDDETLAEMENLKNKGLLSQTIVFAITMVKSVNSNHPALLENLLTRHERKLSKDIIEKLDKEMKPIAQALWELKGNPLEQGKIQEKAIAKRLSAVKLGQDRFSTYKATRNGEDVECIVIENDRTYGKIVIESKKTKRFYTSSVEQVKKYMQKESTPFGILATTSLPDDTLSYTTWIDDVLVVKLDYLESAYIFVREYVKLKRILGREYREKVKEFEVKNRVLVELRNAIVNKQLDVIIGKIDLVASEIDGIADSLEKVPEKIRKKTKRIRKLTTTLVEDHINVIRKKLQG